MLLAEDRLDLLIEQLAAMPARDRRAVLACLTAAERKLMLGHLDRRRDGAAGEASSPYSPDIAERIAAARAGEDIGLTSAARDLLLRAMDPVPGRAQRRSPALVDGLGALLGRQRRQS